MTYNQIYAAVNEVKPTRFSAKAGMVKFEFIQAPEDSSDLTERVATNLTKLGVEYFRGATQVYKFGDTIQRRTWFRVNK